MTRKRKKLGLVDAADLLTRSRHRCALCYGLHRDTAVKKGQIAHLDQDPSNRDLDNLVFLCLDHHDTYDSTTRQSKNFTEVEVKRYRDELYELLSGTNFAQDPSSTELDSPDRASKLRVTAQSVHTPKRCELLVDPEFSLRWLAEEFQAGLGLSTKADTGAPFPFLIRWIMVDIKAEEDWRTIPRGDRFYIYAVVSSVEGVRISKSPRDRLRDAGVYDGAVFHLYPIEEDSVNFPMQDPVGKGGY